MSTDARVTTTDRSQTVGDLIAVLSTSWSLPATNAAAALVLPHFCAALGIDPATPLANIVALTEGQHVVEKRYPAKGEQFVRGTVLDTAQYSDLGKSYVVVASALRAAKEES